MITTRARFDGHVLVPEQPLNLPAGAVVNISIEQPASPPTENRPLAALAEIARMFPDNPDLPTDLAAQHDHYLYGTPKRP
jgi:hypothetical protein